MGSRIHAAIQDQRNPIGRAVFVAFTAFQFGAFQMAQLMLDPGAPAKGGVPQFQKVLAAIKDHLIAPHENHKKETHKKRYRNQAPEGTRKITINKGVHAECKHGQQKHTE